MFFTRTNKKLQSCLSFFAEFQAFYCRLLRPLLESGLADIQQLREDLLMKAALLQKFQRILLLVCFFFLVVAVHPSSAHVSGGQGSVVGI